MFKFLLTCFIDIITPVIYSTYSWVRNKRGRGFLINGGWVGTLGKIKLARGWGGGGEVAISKGGRGLEISKK